MVGYSIKDLIFKKEAARKDIASIADLRKITKVTPDMSFFVENGLFVWVFDDKTPDDGRTSIKPDTVPGRFRRVSVKIG